MSIRVFNANALNDMLASAAQDEHVIERLSPVRATRATSRTNLDDTAASRRASVSASPMRGGGGGEAAAQDLANRERLRRDMRERQFQIQTEKLQRKIERQNEVDSHRHEVEAEAMLRNFAREQLETKPLFKVCDEKDYIDQKKTKHMHTEWCEQMNN